MIYLVGEDARSVPDWFKERLRHIDRALVCYFNPYKQEFCIDRCVHGSDCVANDHSRCEKTNVMLFQHMSESVLDTLKSQDAWTKFGTLDNQRAAMRNAKEEFEAKRVDQAREGYREAAIDDRVQMNRLTHLIQQHDIARVHK